MRFRRCARRLAGIDALGRVAELEVHAGPQAGALLQDRPQVLLGHAGIDRRLQDDDVARCKVFADRSGRLGQRREVGTPLFVDRCRDADDVKVGLAERRGIGGQLEPGSRSSDARF